MQFLAGVDSLDSKQQMSNPAELQSKGFFKPKIDKAQVFLSPTCQLRDAASYSLVPDYNSPLWTNGLRVARFYSPTEKLFTLSYGQWAYSGSQFLSSGFPPHCPRICSHCLREELHRNHVQSANILKNSHRIVQRNLLLKGSQDLPWCFSIQITASLKQACFQAEKDWIQYLARRQGYNNSLINGIMQEINRQGDTAAVSSLSREKLERLLQLRPLRSAFSCIRISSLFDFIRGNIRLIDSTLGYIIAMHTNNSAITLRRSTAQLCCILLRLLQQFTGVPHSLAGSTDLSPSTDSCKKTFELETTCNLRGFAFLQPGKVDWNGWQLAVAKPISLPGLDAPATMSPAIRKPWANIKNTTGRWALIADVLPLLNGKKKSKQAGFLIEVLVSILLHEYRSIASAKMFRQLISSSIETQRSTQARQGKLEFSESSFLQASTDCGIEAVRVGGNRVAYRYGTSLFDYTWTGKREFSRLSGINVPIKRSHSDTLEFRQMFHHIIGHLRQLPTTQQYIYFLEQVLFYRFF